MWWLPLAYGAGGYVFATIVHTVLTRASIPKQHQRYRDELLQLFTRRMQCTAEIADIDQRLVEMHEAAPSEQALWLARTAESAAMLPVRLRDLARGFGFRIPDAPPLAVSVVQHVEQPAAMLHAVGDATQANAWGSGQ